MQLLTVVEVSGLHNIQAININTSRIKTFRLLRRPETSATNGGSDYIRLLPHNP